MSGPYYTDEGVRIDAAALYSDYMDGEAITAEHAALLDETPGVYVLTPAEWAAVAAHGRTLPSTPANNIWD